MHNELIAFLKNDSTRIVVSKMPSFRNRRINVHFASLFDIFNALCENLYLLAENPMRERFLNLISKSLKGNISVPMLYDVEYRKKLWRKIFIDSEVDLPQAACSTEFKMSNYKRNDACGFFINQEVDFSCENIYALLDEILLKIKTNNLNTLFFDARKINFARPDDFHAQKNYENVKNGENDDSTLLLWLVCRVLMNTDAQFYLTVDNAKSAEDISTLVFRLGLEPKVNLCIDTSKFDDFKKIYELLVYYNKKNISLELYCNKENIDILSGILNVIPLVFIETIDVDECTLRKMLSNMLSSYEVERIISHLGKAK